MWRLLQYPDLAVRCYLFTRHRSALTIPVCAQKSLSLIQRTVYRRLPFSHLFSAMCSSSARARADRGAGARRIPLIGCVMDNRRDAGSRAQSVCTEKPVESFNSRAEPRVCNWLQMRNSLLV